MAFLPKAPQTVKDIKQTVATLYPPELVVTIKNGEVSTNVEEPYYIAVPKFMQSEKKTAETPDHLITIDTKADVTDYEKYHTYVLVTKHALVYPRSSSSYSSSNSAAYEYDTGNQRLEVMPLNNTDDMVIDKAFYDKTVSHFLPFVDLLPLGVVILAVLVLIAVPIFASLFVGAWKLAYLLFFGFIIWIISQMMNKKLAFSKVYQICLHTLTIPILIDFVLDLVKVNIPFLYTGVFLVWTLFVLHKLQVHESTHHAKSEAK
jgi:hypothetical protein